MKTHHAVLVVCAAWLSSISGAAAQALTPGLWEHQVTMKTADGKMEAAMAQMQQRLAQMPPEQRKQMEAMMAGSGMQIGGQPGGPTVSRTCLSAEQAARQAAALPEQAPSSCKLVSSSREGSTFRYKGECAAPMQGTVEGETTVLSSKEYRGRNVTRIVREGQPQQMDMTFNAKWVAADCGALKPRP